jgi:hypothetical protein
MKLHRFQAFLHDGKNAQIPRLTVVGLPVLKNEFPILENRHKPGKKRVQDGKASASNRYLRFAHPYEEHILLRRQIREICLYAQGPSGAASTAKQYGCRGKMYVVHIQNATTGKKRQHGLPTPTTDSEMMFSPKVQLVHESK